MNILATEGAALREATTLACKHIAFCLLSAGVFRGEEPLSQVIGEGLRGICDFFSQLSDEDKAAGDFPTRIVVVAFTDEERAALKHEFEKIQVDARRAD